MKSGERLAMTFATQSCRRLTVSVRDPRKDVDSDTVRRNMKRLINSEVFLSRDGSSCAYIRKAAVIKTTVTVVFQ